MLVAIYTKSVARPLFPVFICAPPFFSAGSISASAKNTGIDRLTHCKKYQFGQDAASSQVWYCVNSLSMCYPLLSGINQTNDLLITI